VVRREEGNKQQTNQVRYALLFSILECYDQHGQSANAITITGTAVQKAIEVCELFKKHTLHFLVKAKEIKPKLFKL
jgi:DNA-binding protein